MLYMLEFHYTRDNRERALSYIWEHGTTRYEGDVTLNYAWVATKDCVAYALIKAKNEEEMAKAVMPLETLGDVRFRRVTPVDSM